MTAPARLVVLDLGGVLVRIRSTWEEACEAAGVAARVEEVPWRALPEAIVALDSGQISDEAYFRLVAGASGGAYRAAEVARVHAAWIAGEYPGVPALFDAIEAKGRAEIGILSNTSAAHWARLGPPEFPSLPRARHAHASHRLRAAKPSPLAYARYQEAVGRSGEEILFFDDRAENVEAAAAAGWGAVLVPRHDDPPSWVIERLAALGLA